MSALENAVKFFHACENAQGWAECQKYAVADASFFSAAPSYDGMNQLSSYCDQTADVFKTTFLGSTYELVASAYDPDTRIALLHGMSYAQHTGEGGPVPATHNKAQIPFVYSVKFNDDQKIVHLEKIFDPGLASRQLGWSEG